jgi:hypothetical protein
MSKISQLLSDKIQVKIFNRGRQTAVSWVLLVSLGIILALVLPTHAEDRRQSS